MVLFVFVFLKYSKILSQFRYQILMNSNTSNQLSTKVSYDQQLICFSVCIYLSYFSFVYDWIDNCNRVKRMKKKKKKKWVLQPTEQLGYSCVHDQIKYVCERETEIEFSGKKKFPSCFSLAPCVGGSLSHCCVLHQQFRNQVSLTK